MEFIEEAEECIADAEEGFAAESEDIADMTEEEQIEIKEARAKFSKFASVASDFKTFALKYATKAYAQKFATFVIKNVAITAVMFGAQKALEAMFKKGGAEGDGAKEKIAKVKKITDLITTETALCTKIKDWLTKHVDDTVTLAGIEIPLGSIFYKYTEAINDAVDKAFAAAKPLQKKIGDKVTYNVPTVDDITKLENASEAFITAFDNFRKFAEDESSKVAALKSVPVTSADIDTLNSELDDIKKMTF